MAIFRRGLIENNHPLPILTVLVKRLSSVSRGLIILASRHGWVFMIITVVFNRMLKITASILHLTTLCDQFVNKTRGSL